MRPPGQPNEISQIFATLLGKLLLELQISGGSVKKTFKLPAFLTGHTLLAKM
jgi:hypothetical protein